jgi:hypothetical protein
MPQRFGSDYDLHVVALVDLRLVLEPNANLRPLEQRYLTLQGVACVTLGNFELGLLSQTPIPIATLTSNTKTPIASANR